MTFDLRWKIDLRPMAAARVRQHAEQAVSDVVEHLGEEANRTAPIDEAVLVGSMTATTDGLKGAVAYDTPYAARQHEDTRLRHDAGRRAKWLELTFRERASDVTKWLADTIRGAF